LALAERAALLETMWAYKVLHLLEFLPHQLEAGTAAHQALQVDLVALEAAAVGITVVVVQVLLVKVLLAARVQQQPIQGVVVEGPVQSVAQEQPQTVV
jgi:hypothetical protein